MGGPFLADVDERRRDVQRHEPLGDAREVGAQVVGEGERVAVEDELPLGGERARGVDVLGAVVDDYGPRVPDGLFEECAEAPVGLEAKEGGVLPREREYGLGEDACPRTVFGDVLRLAEVDVLEHAFLEVLRAWRDTAYLFRVPDEVPEKDEAFLRP